MLTENAFKQVPGEESLSRKVSLFGGAMEVRFPPRTLATFFSQKVFIGSFCERQFPHKSVNLYSIITDIKKMLTNL